MGKVYKKPAAAAATVAKTKKQKKCCSVCGSTKHRLETCKHPAAKQIRALRAKLKGMSMKKFRRKPKRRTPKRTGAIAMKVMKMYTKKPDAKKKKGTIKTRGRCPPAQGGANNPNILDLSGSEEKVLEILQALGFYQKVLKCPECSAKMDDPKPRVDEAEGHLYYRCTVYACDKHESRMNVGKFSFHEGTCKLGLRQVRQQQNIAIAVVGASGREVVAIAFVMVMLRSV